MIYKHEVGRGWQCKDVVTYEKHHYRGLAAVPGCHMWTRQQVPNLKRQTLSHLLAILPQ